MEEAILGVSVCEWVQREKIKEWEIKKKKEEHYERKYERIVVSVS